MMTEIQNDHDTQNNYKETQHYQRDTKQPQRDTKQPKRHTKQPQRDTKQQQRDEVQRKRENQRRDRNAKELQRDTTQLQRCTNYKTTNDAEQPQRGIKQPSPPPSSSSVPGLIICERIFPLTALRMFPACSTRWRTAWSSSQHINSGGERSLYLHQHTNKH
ncbi:hypothetical protein P7M41_26735, partial [Vibrio parahaemolyticus]|nr:hypothetical protein [Vibrio parahaemolyticus]